MCAWELRRYPIEKLTKSKKLSKLNVFNNVHLFHTACTKQITFSLNNILNILALTRNRYYSNTIELWSEMNWNFQQKVQPWSKWLISKHLLILMICKILYLFLFLLFVSCYWHLSLKPMLNRVAMCFRINWGIYWKLR